MPRLELVEEVLREYYLDRAMTGHEIAEQTGWSRQLVQKRLKAYGIPSRSRGPRPGATRPDRRNPTDTARIRALYEGGLSLAAVGEAVGMSGAGVAMRLRSEGVVLSPRPKGHPAGPSHPNWNGGTTRRDGYVLRRAPSHPAAVNGYVLEHRLVMEQKIGRYLRDEEIVHHINHVRDDNRPENLMLLIGQAEHSRLHGEERRTRATMAS
jgi:hypothetical protein